MFNINILDSIIATEEISGKKNQTTGTRVGLPSKDKCKIGYVWCNIQVLNKAKG